ncbi:MAG: Rrf2 family transcriptional regulator [Chlamydiota bacterium]|nr:Rrf2 family transcriptional regulator [Chlamydiota bacterium]
MIYSRTSEYAIRALSYIASKQNKSRATVEEISLNTKVPMAYIAKIFQCLVKAKILRSYRGPNGGYALISDPHQLSLMKIIQALDDARQSPLSHCIMGFAFCSSEKPCPVHDIWATAKEKICNKLSESTVLDMVKLNGQFRSHGQKRIKLSKNMRDVFHGLNQA